MKVLKIHPALTSFALSTLFIRIICFNISPNPPDLRNFNKMQCDISNEHKASQKPEVDPTPESPKPIPCEDGSSQYESTMPFSTTVPKLQRRIPLHLLPEKLIVHDPSNTLFVKSPRPSNTKEIKRVYNLKLSSTGRELREKQREQAERGANSRNKSSVAEGGFIKKIEEETAVEGPRVSMEIYPPRPTTPEAHLYLSPKHEAGQGNHSVVYRAEFKLPRSMLIEDRICQQCALESALKKVGEGDSTSFDPLSFFRQPVVNFPKIESVVVHPEIQPKKIISEKGIPAVLLQFTTNTQSASGEPGTDSDASSGTSASDSEEKIPTRFYTVKSAKDKQMRADDKPTHRLYPDVKWQNPEREPYCKHLQSTKDIPLAAKVSVAAKLSIQYDVHLEREARNYQKFPTNLFEHWDVPPLHDPVPVGAVVPNFYGYYTPEKREVDKNGYVQYLSPILLIEDCGVPIVTRRLGEDDSIECASLLDRFHAAHWVHGSVAERNIVVQPGPLNESPLFHTSNSTKSFRLIDFGRSVYSDDRRMMSLERHEVKYLFS